MEKSNNTGTLTVWVTASRAQLPVEGATVAVTTAEGAEEGRTLLSLQVTDESGWTAAITLPSAPGDGMGLTPGGPVPFADYALWVEHPGYEVARVDRFQIFPGVDSVQQVSLIPLSSPAWEGEGVSDTVGSQPQDL